MKIRWILLATVAAAATLVVVTVNDRQPMRSEYCTADVGPTHVQVDLEQAQWASLMSAISARKNLPPRATTIAITTAYQESKIHNIDYGDRDSLGLFQQRPSQGWGSEAQVLDPHYSIDRFFQGLVKVKGYESMEITKAAQAVQRSAFPGAYANHEAYARALASSLRGYSPSTFSCQLNQVSGGTPDNVTADLTKSFGPIELQVTGSTVQASLSGTAAEKSIRGWTYAHYLVANAKRLGIAEVRFGGSSWSVERSPDGWVKTPGVTSDRVSASVS